MIAFNQLLTRREAAESLHQSVRTIDYLIASGELPAVRIGRSIRIRQSAIDLFVEAREARERRLDDNRRVITKKRRVKKSKKEVVP